MDDTFDTKLQRYAELTVRVGLNLQRGQRLVVLGPGGQNGVPLEAAPLVRRIAAEAYRQGARFVDVMWGDEALRRIRFENAPRDSFDDYPTWQATTAFEYAQRGDAVLIISGSNPGLLAGQDPDLVSQAQRSGSNHTAPFSTLLSANAMNWSVVAYPGEGWAAVVLPDVATAERQARLWMSSSTSAAPTSPTRSPPGRNTCTACDRGTSTSTPAATRRYTSAARERT